MTNARKYSLLSTAIFSLLLSADGTPADPAPFAPPDPFNIVNNEGGFHSSGVAWGDYDQDGDVDLFVANPGNHDNRLYRNDGNGRFSVVLDGPPVNDGGFSSGAVWADYNNDGALDLFVSNQNDQDNFLYRNLGGGAFERVESGDIVSDRGDSYAAAWGDYDNDGYLDLYVANNYGQVNFLYHNRGDGTFERVMEGPHVEEVRSSYSPTWIDYDLDGDQDLYVVSFAEGEANSLYRNRGDGTFESVLDSVLVRDRVQSSGATWGDPDNDGDPDLFVTNGGYYQNGVQVDAFYRNLGEGKFEKITLGPLVNTADSSLTAQWADYDNDGDEDLFVAVFRGNNFLYRNDGGRLHRVRRGFMVTHGGHSDGAAWADHNGDGALDLVVSNWENSNNWLFTNVGNSHHKLAVALVGSRSNRMGLGARLVLEAKVDGEDLTQTRFLSAHTGGRGQNAPEAHFGLGEKAETVRLTVHWPSGQKTEIDQPPIDRKLVVAEESGLKAQKAFEPAPPSALGELSAALSRGSGEALIETCRRLLKDGHYFGTLDARVLRGFAGYLFDSLSPEQGIEMYLAGIEIFPHSAGLAYDLAESYRSLGKEPEAVAAYGRALELLERDETLIDTDKKYIRRQCERWV